MKNNSEVHEYKQTNNMNNYATIVHVCDPLPRINLIDLEILIRRIKIILLLIIGLEMASSFYLTLISYNDLLLKTTEVLLIF